MHKQLHPFFSLGRLARATAVLSILALAPCSPTLADGGDEVPAIDADVLAASRGQPNPDNQLPPPVEAEEGGAPAGGEGPMSEAQIVRLVEAAKGAFRLGDYDGVVRETTLAIERNAPEQPEAAEGEEERPAPPPDVRLAYLRGRSALKIGLFDQAAQDLGPLKGKAPIEKWSGADVLLEELRLLERIVPQNVHEVSSGGRVAFRVYYDEDSPWTQAVIAALPRAYAVSRQMFGVEMSETPVFIFATYPRFRDFHIARWKKAPGSWVSCVGGVSGFCISPQNARGNSQMSDPRNARFRTVIAHEYNHTMARRIAGSGELPRWLSEGLAMTADTLMEPELVAQYTRQLARAMAVNALVDPAQLRRGNTFEASTEFGLAANDAGQMASSPYAQSLHMTTFLLGLLRQNRVSLTQFLFELRGDKKFDATLANATGLAPQQFALAWLQNARRTLQ